MTDKYVILDSPGGLKAHVLTHAVEDPEIEMTLCGLEFPESAIKVSGKGSQSEWGALPCGSCIQKALLDNMEARMQMQQDRLQAFRNRDYRAMVKEVRQGQKPQLVTPETE